MDTSSTGATSSTGSNSSEKMNYALQVALQTMKERCLQLQQRCNSVEEENQKLREGAYNTSAGPAQGDLAEIQSLRIQVADLERQKEQLGEHINMVSNENRRLWSRLSQLSKDQAQQLEPLAAEKSEDPATPTPNSGSAAAIGANQNLIRSKTFTQHSPNPHLRQKMISDGMRDISLEEIALDNFAGAGETFGEGLGYPYGMSVEQATEREPGADAEANKDAKRCMDSLQELRREAMKQQQELSSALTLLETRIALQPCPECIKKAAHKPEMADKSLETDESLNTELKRYHSEHKQEREAVNGHNGHLPITPPATRLNIIQEKLKADAMDKTCPMCGKLYSSQVSFKAFQEHVEMHFIDDSLEVDSSIERNYEIISHMVGDF